MTLHRLLPALFACTLAACPPSSGTISSGPGPTRPMPPDRPAPPRWDSSGWTLLGTQTVDGNTDRDVIAVSQRARWDKLTMVVDDSDLILIDFNVEFANGERWSPKLKYEFREGQRTHAIDLPGDDRHISKIELLYKNTPGGGRARVQIYAKDTKGGGTVVVDHPPPPPPPPPAWDPAGWTLLGSQTVEGKRDKDSFAVGRKLGKFDKLMVVVKDSDLEMIDFVVTFDNREKFDPKLKHRFYEGERTRAIDLPGNDRYIQKIDVKYANLAGSGKARVEIYAKDTRNAPTPPPPGGGDTGFDSTGWTLLGSQTVEGKRDKDTYVINGKGGRMDVLVVVVKDSDLEMTEFIVTFQNGEKWDPKKLRHVFKEGSRSHNVDLPKSDRQIKQIDVKYANLPGTGKARVEIYGRDTKQGADPKKPKK